MGKDQPHKKSNQGFASGKYNPEKKNVPHKEEAGKQKFLKDFAAMSPERRREVARKGGLA